MKTKINVSYNYGGWNISFSKSFNFPFTPFAGMCIIDDENKDVENYIELRETDYRSIDMSYSTKDEQFYIDVRNLWNRPVRPDVIDETIDMFEKTNWERQDNTDIDKLKELMDRNK